ncbi:hypothetical protein JQX13_51850 [Archangium violaceum]|uniref:hypothetical protein n=1 Tax=Archangium violaceum TaxID=83451 RepID=UPI00193B04F0|nr:hypothetical protein [Archangium violaceum]QRK08329.1 hypothetical protein JQX13_51850 [Archangium violaceum]
MRLRCLAVVLLLSGCQQSARPEPVNEAGHPASPGKEKDPGAQPIALEAPGAPQPSAAEELPEQTWSARSADGRAEVRQAAHRNGTAPRCTTTSTLSPPGDEPSVVWEWNTCIATREQLKFVSPDGKRVLVLEPLPASPQGNWKGVEVAALYEHGVRMKGAKAGALVNAPLQAREPFLHFSWVKGQGGLEGAPPRYTSDGKAVELETVDGRSFRLDFTGGGFPAASEEQQAFAESAEMYRYKDDKGTVHFVGSREEIPDRYRARAMRVEAEVGVLTMRGPLAGEEPTSSAPTPEPQSPSGAGREPAPKKSLENPQLATPAELIERARDTVKQLEESQRGREKLADSQLGVTTPSEPGSAPAANKDPSPKRPLDAPGLANPTELLERAREAAKKLEAAQGERDRLMEEKP